MTHIGKYIKDAKDKGHRLIGCLPLYPPLELFHSLKLTPVTLWGLSDSTWRIEKSDKHLQPFACSVARCLTDFVLSEDGAALDGLFVYNACDTLRNLPEILSCGLKEGGRTLPIFKIHIPMAPQAQTDGSSYLKVRIETLIRELEEAFRVSFSLESFRHSVSLFREIRNFSRELESRVAEGLMSYAEFSRTIRGGWFIPVEDQLLSLRKLLRTGSRSAYQDASPSGQGRIIISGILPPPSKLILAFESAGLTVVGNDVASQTRSLVYTPTIVDDPASYYVDFYQRHYPCTTLLYTADKRLAAIRELISRTAAQGFVFIGEKFCEYEYFEIPNLEKALNDMGIFTLFLEMSISDDERSASYETRIEAFAESMRSSNNGGRYATIRSS
ncbi:MAG: 2-hydroxyacyl-CoA dehydratase subunit D [Desulfomonilaceae bacterium]